eukprot:492144_1
MTTDQDKHANKDIKGAFKRSATEFHDKITAKDSKYTAEKGRYHLYYSGACPWCHRVLVMIALKGLEDVISASNVSPLVHGHGTPGYVSWQFNKDFPDPLHKNSKNVWDIYKIHDKDYTNQKLTVPILFDKKTSKIVSNESAEIIVFLNTEFNNFAKNPQTDLNPDDEKIQSLMTQWNDMIYPCLNDGVYRCGFASTQEAFDDSYFKIFDTLDKMEKQLSETRYLCGNQLTFTDIRAWVTLIRFDGIYHTHFKCNLKMIQYDYPNIYGYTRDIYQMPHVAKTFDMEHAKLHYYGSHAKLNPKGLVPKGPFIDFNKPHGRDKQQYSGKVDMDEEQKKD